MFAHWVSCLWFLIGYASLASNYVDGIEGISPNGEIARKYGAAEFSDYPLASDTSFGDSWLMRHFGPMNIHGDYNKHYTNSVAYLARHNATGAIDIKKFIAEVGVEQIYFTSMYASKSSTVCNKAALPPLLTPSCCTYTQVLVLHYVDEVATHRS